jgi:hypothetical protein
LPETSKYLIYGLVDPRTDDIRYIGQSSRGLARPHSHGWVSALRTRKTHTTAWIKSLRRAGFDYTVVILEVVNHKNLLGVAERRWIRCARELGWHLTNHTEGGEGRTGVCSRRQKLHLKRAACTRWGNISEHQRMSERVKKLWALPEFRKGQEETREVLSWRIAASERQGGRPIIDQYGVVYPSAAIAADILGLRPSHVSSVLHGKLPHTRNYVLRYVTNRSPNA